MKESLAVRIVTASRLDLNQLRGSTSSKPLNLHNSTLIRPLEELLHQKWSPLRGELDSSTLEVSGVLLVAVVEALL